MPTGALKLGTRGSPLARWQADYVTDRLVMSGHAVERVLISTSGDRNTAGPIASLGVTGAFTKEIQRALIERRIDIAVHSLKDLPTENPPELVVAAIPRRGACGDVLVTADGRALDQLPRGARVGTGSLRRRAHLWHVRPDLEMVGVRGNVDTRLRKMLDGEFAALVLAEAGLARLELGAGMTWLFPHDILLPAVGQGALGIEVHAENEAARAATTALDDPPTHAAAIAERALLAALTAGCLAPVGAHAHWQEGRLHLSASVLSADGRQRLLAHDHVSAKESADHYAAELGRRVADELIAQGASALIQAARDGE
jgi:hydroxymethylbilane synthase